MVRFLGFSLGQFVQDDGVDAGDATHLHAVDVDGFEGVRVRFREAVQDGLHGQGFADPRHAADVERGERGGAHGGEAVREEERDLLGLGGAAREGGRGREDGREFQRGDGVGVQLAKSREG